MDQNYYGNICYCRKCNGLVHTIKKGDSLYLLSRHYNVPIGEIMNANRNLNVYNLQIGEEICIPVRREDMLRDMQPAMETSSVPDDSANSQTSTDSFDFDKSMKMADLIAREDMTFEKFLELIQN